MKLKGMTWDHPRGYEPVVAASKLFAQQIGIEIEWSKRSLQAFADEPILGLAENYDFIVLDHPHVGQIAETGALLPLPKPDDSSASLGGSAESYFWQDQCWAYAVDAACQMSAYRPDLITDLPGYWEDFMAPGADRYQALTPLLPVDAFDMMMTLVAGKGGEVMPINRQQFVSDELGEYSLKVLRALYNLGPDEQVDMNPIAVLEAMSSTNEFHCSPCLFGYVNYAYPDFREHRIAYFDMPVSFGHKLPRGILGGAGIGVSAFTKQPKEAVEFAQWITSQEIQSGVYLQNNGQPANRHTWLEQQSNAAVSGFFKGGFHTIDNAWTRPRDEWFLHFVNDVCEIMPDFFRKQIPETEFLGTINKLYQHHIKGVQP